MWETWASIEVAPDQAAAVAEAAGADPHDSASCIYSGGRLYVRDVDQTALGAALSGYDPLPAARAGALAEIDRRAGEERAKYLTDILGQELVYQAKREEAEAWIGAGQPGEPEPADYLIASAEASACGRTLAAQLGIYAAESAAWKALAGAMEGVRMAAKEAVRTAASASEIEAILGGLTWPEPA